MTSARLSNQKGDIKTKYCGYSFWYLIFGPLYLIVKLRFVLAIFILIIYYYFLPIPGMDFISSHISNLFSGQAKEAVIKFLMFFRQDYIRWGGVAITIFLQIYFAFSIEGYLVKKFIKKKKYLPITERDARILIKAHAANESILLCDEAFSQNIPAQNTSHKKIPYLLDETKKTRMEMIKESEIALRIENLERLYQLGQLNKEEFEIQRAKLLNKR